MVTKRQINIGLRLECNSPPLLPTIKLAIPQKRDHADMTNDEDLSLPFYHDRTLFVPRKQQCTRDDKPLHEDSRLPTRLVIRPLPHVKVSHNNSVCYESARDDVTVESLGFKPTFCSMRTTGGANTHQSTFNLSDSSKPLRPHNPAILS